MSSFGNTVASGTIVDKYGGGVFTRRAEDRLSLVGGYIDWRYGIVAGLGMKFFHYIQAIAANGHNLLMKSDFKKTINHSYSDTYQGDPRYQIEIEFTHINGIYQTDYKGTWFTNINLYGELKSDPEKLPPGLIYMPRDKFLSKTEDEVRTLDTILAIRDSFSSGAVYNQSITDLSRIKIFNHPETNLTGTPLYYPRTCDEKGSKPFNKNEITVTGAIIENEFGEYLLVRCVKGNKGDPDSKNKYSFAGGKAERGHTLIQDIVREVKEETENTIVPLGFVVIAVVEYLPDLFATNFIPYAKVRKNNINTKVPKNRDHEISEIAWVTYDWLKDNQDQLRTREILTAIDYSRQYKNDNNIELIPNNMIKQCTMIKENIW